MTDSPAYPLLARRQILAGAAGLAAFAAAPSLATVSATRPPARIVSIGGVVTEILHAIGQGDRLVARDSSSSFPEAALALPDVGYMRALSAEGVLSMRPDAILALEGSGPPQVLAQIAASGVPLTMIPDGFDRAAISAKIRAVGLAVGASDAANALSARVLADVDAASAAVRPGAERPRVVFCLSAATGRIMAGGAGTAADALITLAGGENALSAMSGYKPVADEAVIAASPDLILVMTRPGVSLDGLADLPAFAATPAGRAGRLTGIDGLAALGFGPRTGAAIRSLAAELGTAGPDRDPDHG